MQLCNLLLAQAVNSNSSLIVFIGKMWFDALMLCTACCNQQNFLGSNMSAGVPLFPFVPPCHIMNVGQH